MAEIKLDALLCEVAKHLDGWAVICEWENYGYLRHLQTGAKLNVHLNVKKGTLSIVSYKRHGYGEIAVGRIGVSALRPAQAIAKEIERRVLPGYIEAFIAAEEKAKAFDAEGKEYETWVTGLTERYDGLRLQHAHSGNVSGVSCMVEEARISLDYPPHASGVSMSLHWLSREQALAVMDALLCPNVDKNRTVVVTVSGGVAEVRDCPDGVEVEIIDYDGDNCEVCGEPLPNDHEGWVCVSCMEGEESNE